MEPRIGILTYGDDPHGHLVMQKIHEQHGIGCCLVPSDALDLRGRLAWSSRHDPPALLPTLDGETVEARTLDALWHRRASSTRPADGDVERVLEGILLNEFRGQWVSHPVATRLAENRLVQLRAAERAGLRIPTTLVSQDPVQIRSFCAAHPGARREPVTPPPGAERASTAMVRRELLDDAALSLTPAIYQEDVAGRRRLRIFVVGERCDATLVEPEAIDGQAEPSLPFRPFALGEDLEQLSTAALRELGLVMGTIDVKLTDDGEPVFLAVRPQAASGLPLADMLAAFLVDQAMAGFGSRRRSVGPSLRALPRPADP
jgi:hypothetical protein